MRRFSIDVDPLKKAKLMHKVLPLSMMSICSCNTDAVATQRRGELYLDLIRVHRAVIFAAQKLPQSRTRFPRHDSHGPDS